MMALMWFIWHDDEESVRAHRFLSLLSLILQTNKQKKLEPWLQQYRFLFGEVLLYYRLKVERCILLTALAKRDAQLTMHHLCLLSLVASTWMLTFWGDITDFLPSLSSSSPELLQCMFYQLLKMIYPGNISRATLYFDVTFLRIAV